MAIGLSRKPAISAAQTAMQVLRDVDAEAGEPRPLYVCGRPGPAERVRDALLADGGAPGAAQAFALRRLRPDDRDLLKRAAVVVYAGEITEALDAGTRSDLAVVGSSGRPIVAVLEALDQPGNALIEAARTPGLPPSAVVGAKPGSFPERQVLQAVAERAGPAGPALAARLPALRPAVIEQVIAQAARHNGATASLVPMPREDMVALTAVELRMVLQIAACHGERLSADRLLEVASVVGAGLGMRALARELLGVVPVAGWMVKSAVAYSGTRGIGRAAAEYFERGAPADVGKLRQRAEQLRG
ncbi:MAG: DUF697 domain-containing protein [Gaiellales bacterium]